MTGAAVPSHRLRVASDVGGTFTDNLAYDEAARRITVAKVPTTPENRALGTVQGLLRALALQGRAGGDVGYVGHGMVTPRLEHGSLREANQHEDWGFVEGLVPDDT